MKRKVISKQIDGILPETQAAIDALVPVIQRELDRVDEWFRYADGYTNMGCLFAWDTTPQGEGFWLVANRLFEVEPINKQESLAAEIARHEAEIARLRAEKGRLLRAEERAEIKGRGDWPHNG